tara:strand:- start:831 stop:1616 length:786 start_codon:yes stop_codon:yes gene_type:complete
LGGNNYLIKKDLITRVISSIFLIILALLFNYLGELYFFSAVALVSIVLLYEFYKLFNAEIIDKKFLFNSVIGLISITFVFYEFYIFFVYLLFAGLFLSISFSKNHYFLVIIPFIYIFSPLAALIYLNSYTDGKLLICWIFAVVWTVDISGYIFGKSLKGPKLIPSISPNKTWSGFIAGIFLAGFFSIIYSYFLELGEYIKYFVLGFTGAILSVAGDLFESKLKRINKKKDSSNLVPGHGGLLDRLDGFLFAILYFWMLSFI